MCGGCGKAPCCGLVPKSTRMFCCSPCMQPMCPPPRSRPEMCCEHPCDCPDVCFPCACEPRYNVPKKIRCFAFTAPPKWVSTVCSSPCYQPCNSSPTLLSYKICPTPCCCPKTFTCVEAAPCGCGGSVGCCPQ